MPDFAQVKEELFKGTSVDKEGSVVSAASVDVQATVSKMCLEI